MTSPSFLFRNLGWKILALAIALLLWFVFAAQRRERISERTYRIALSLVNVPPQMVIASPLPDSVDVRLRGPFTALRQLDPAKLEAVIDLADAPRGEHLYRLAPEDINAPQEVEVIAISPGQVRVVLDAMTEKRVPIAATLVGEPAAGHTVREVTVDPQYARVAGPASVLDAMTRVPTDPVSIADRSASLSVPATVLPDAPGVRVREGQIVTVNVRIAAAEEPTPDSGSGGQDAAAMKLFGTDGLRGRAGDFPLDPDSVRIVGERVGSGVRASGGAPRVVLGGDTRESTPELMRSLAGGLESAGCGVACAGIVPTPGVAEIVLALSAGAGISVSASHNPYPDNGIKIFGADGRKWPDELESALENVLIGTRETDGDTAGREEESREPPPGPPARANTGSGLQTDARLAEIYLARLAQHLPVRLSGLSVLVDAGNGAAYRLGPRALSAAGAAVEAISDSPDGRNINAGCGALYPEGMARATRQSGAAMGVAFDGDADRAIFADETGRILDGDDVLWVVARDWKEKGILRSGGVVGTVMSNFGLEAALEREKILFHRSAVGDRNVARLMDETGAAIGGETSGHVLLPFSPAGDGIQTALLLASICAERRLPLSELATLAKVPQALRNVVVSRRLPIEEIPGVAAATARARETLGNDGRVFVRYSGTEPLLRILVEGVDGARVAAIADELEAAVREELA